MIRGTRVGQAYVDLTVKGDNLDKKIADQFGDTLGNEIEKAGEKHGRKYTQGFDNEFSRAFFKGIDDAAKEAEKRFDDAGRRAGQKFSTAFDRANARTFSTNFGSLGGQFAGAGALRVLGSAIDGIVHGLSNLSVKSQELRHNFDVGFKGAAEDATLLKKAISGLTNLDGRPGLEVAAGRGGRLFDSVAQALPVIGLASVGISTLDSVVVGLLGSVVALASAIAGGLTVSLLGTGAALGAATAGAALLTLGFLALDKAQKSVLKSDLRGVSHELAGIGQIVDRSLVPAFHTWTVNIENAIARLGPLANAVGPSLAQAGDIITRSFNGPGFQKFITGLTHNLPDITTNLAHAFGEFSNAALATFAILLPYVRDFSAYIDRAVTRFNAFAQSTSGHNQIVSFVRESLDSLKSLTNFAGSIGGLLSKVLFSAQAQGAGQNLFDSMAASVRKFTASLNASNMQHFFDIAVTSGKILGAVFVDLGRIIGVFVSSGGIATLNLALTALGNIVSALLPIIKAFLDIFDLLAPVITDAANALNSLNPAILQSVSGGILLLSFLSKSTIGMKLFAQATEEAGAATVLFSSETAAAAATAGSTGLLTRLAASSFGQMAIKVGGAAAAYGGFQLATTHANNALAVLGGSALTAAGVFAATGSPWAAGIAGAVTLLVSLSKRTDDVAAHFRNMGNAIYSATARTGNFASGTGTIVAQLNAINSRLAEQAHAYDVLSQHQVSGGQAGYDYRNKLIDLNNEMQKSKSAADGYAAAIRDQSASIIDEGNQLGLDTSSWKTRLAAVTANHFADAVSITKTLENARALEQEGYQLDVNGNKLLNLNNVLVDYAQRANLSANATLQLIAGIRSLPPKTIVELELRINEVIAQQTLKAAAPTLDAIKNAHGNPLALMTGLLAQSNNITKANQTATSSVNAQLDSIVKNYQNLVAGVGNISTPSSLRGLGSGGLSNPFSSGGGGGGGAKSAAQQAATAIAQANKIVLNAIDAANKATSEAAAKSVLTKAVNQLEASAASVKLAKARAEILAAARDLAKQEIYNSAITVKLINGVKVANATLVDYAQARAVVAAKLKAANAALAADKTQLADYIKTVTDATEQFAALTTAQAQVINGITRPLTSTDITSNLASKLADIKKFQANLNILRAQGLSDAAYKQLVDAGVAQGGAYAQALVNGGQGSVASVNSLTAQVDAAAKALGLQAGDSLYLAGVNAAQGLVDGLKSREAQLTKAGEHLGAVIAKAVKKALGIKSPSVVMMAEMEHVGDGIAIGLDRQHGKVGNAATRLSARISPSPEVSNWQAQAGGVSGNGVNVGGITIVTPTKDPRAVAAEVMNELTGKLL